MKPEEKEDDLYWQALGQMLVECPRWKWSEGMLQQRTHKTILAYRGAVRLSQKLANDSNDSLVSFSLGPDYEVWPDLRDDATFGCVYRLVQRAWGDHRIHFMSNQDIKPDMSGKPRREYWIMRSPRRGRCGYGDSSSDAQALLCALEGAPERRISGER